MERPDITTAKQFYAWLDVISKDSTVQAELTEVLDEMVHEVMSRDATDINNSGIPGQINFLLGTDQGNIAGLVRDIADALSD